MSDDLDQILEYLAVELLGWAWTGENGVDTGGGWITRSDARKRLLTGDGMLEVIEAMRNTRGHSFQCWSDQQDSEQVVAGFKPWKDRRMPFFPGEWMAADTLPEAVARAAYQALRGEGDHGE